MKKINSINYGGKVIEVGLFFMIIIPIILWLIHHVIECPIVVVIAKGSVVIAKGSVVIGLILLCSFGIYLGIELRQDRKIN